MPSRAAGYLLCGLAMATVGSTIIASKLIAGGIPPFTATAIRFGIAFPLLAALMVTTRTTWPRPGRRDTLLLLVQAGSGSVGYTVLLIAGMNLTNAVSAGAIAGTLPAVAAIVAVVVLRERLDRAVLPSIALAVAGVLFVTVRSDGGAAGATPAALAGNALVLGATACEAIFILLNRKLRVPIPPLALSTLMTGTGLVLAAIPALLERPWTITFETLPLLGVLYYATIPTVGGFLLWYAGSKRISGAEASLSTAVAPVSAVVIAALVLSEPVSTTQLAGIACVVVAIVLPISRGFRRRGPTRKLQDEPSSASADVSTETQWSSP